MKFSIRDVLWLTLVAAMGAALVSQHLAAERRVAEALKEAKATEARNAAILKAVFLMGMTTAEVDGKVVLRRMRSSPFAVQPPARPTENLVEDKPPTEYPALPDIPLPELSELD